jgi:predicted DNA-binding transcriptional regulator AlpA
MELLRTPQAAKSIGLSQSTLHKLRLKGTGPRFVKLGRAVAYDPADLRAWIEAHKRASTSEAA